MAISSVIAKVRKELEALDLVSFLPTARAVQALGLSFEAMPFRVPIQPPAWVDDVAFLILTNATFLLDKSAVAAACVWNTFRQFMMVLNMLPGKTALMPFFDGPKSEVARRKFSEPKDDMLPAPYASGVTDLHVQCVRKYKRMGRILLPCGSVLPEITSRHGSTRLYIDRLSF